MRTSSMLTRQVSGGRGRGVCGARKLIPMPLRILRAPGRPTFIGVRQSTISRIVVLVFPGGRGVCGARKLIPMPQKISCAPDLLGTLTPRSPHSLPPLRPLVAALHFVPPYLGASLSHPCPSVFICGYFLSAVASRRSLSDKQVRRSQISRDRWVRTEGR